MKKEVKQITGQTSKPVPKPVSPVVKPEEPDTKPVQPIKKPDSKPGIKPVEVKTEPSNDLEKKPSVTFDTKSKEAKSKEKVPLTNTQIEPMIG